MRHSALPLLLCLLLAGCGKPSPIAIEPRLAQNRSAAIADPASELDAAQATLVLFFDLLSQRDYESASRYHVAPNPLAFQYPDVEAEDGSALLERACEPAQASVCRFYCWRISEIVDRTEASPSEFYFTVRFEDDDGNQLVGGDNVTPRVCDPAGCMHSEYDYTVVKEEGKFLVDGIPVFTGCWP